MRLSRIALVSLLLAKPLIADDGAASIAAGGLAFKREPGIVMAKEVLTISQARVIVDYEFRNDTDADITTEVAFPIPPYRLGESELLPKEQGFDDFKLEVNGKSVQFRTNVVASVAGRDVTGILEKYELDAATFSHADDDAVPDLHQLTETQEKSLMHLGILKQERIGSVYPNWTVKKRCHWTQTFKAHATTFIHHEYTPVVGGNQIPSEYINSAKTAGTDSGTRRELHRALASLCLRPSEKTRIAGTQATYWFSWVDFVLTTANTWRQPIEDFTLNVERGNAKNSVSFCWDGTVESAGAEAFVAHRKNFIPRNELRVGFYQPMTF